MVGCEGGLPRSGFVCSLPLGRGHGHLLSGRATLTRYEDGVAAAGLLYTPPQWGAQPPNVCLPSPSPVRKRLIGYRQPGVPAPIDGVIIYTGAAGNITCQTFER